MPQPLKKAGITVILQTVPPFDYAESIRPAWNDVNGYIKNVLSLEADAVFDVVPILGERERPYMAKFGGHPNARGHKLWAEALAPVIKTYME